MPSQFNSPEGNLEDYFVSESWLIDQYIGDKLYAWGQGSYGQLGTNNNSARSTPVTTFAGGTNWKQVSGGDIQAAAIKTDGTLWTWGYGGNGELGTNDISSSKRTPVTTFAGGTNWKQVTCGKEHTAAIKTDGTLWTWGYNNYGQLGTDDTTPSRSTPVTTFAGGTDWKQVACGNEHTAAVKTDGTLWTWGYATYGLLGTNDLTHRSTPVTTFAGGTNWKQVSGGDQHTAAIKTDGTLWTWGRNSSGNLGTNDTTNRSTPVTTFAGGTNWKQVDCGFRSTSAVKNDGTLWNWGFGGQGSLGNASTSDSDIPVTTFAGGTNWKQVSCGIKNVRAAIKTDGTLWTWGRGDFLSLGNNSNTLSNSTPVTTFAGGNNWRQVSSGGYHVLAITTGISPDLPIA